MNNDKLNGFFMGVVCGAIATAVVATLITGIVGSPIRRLEAEAVRLDYGYYYPDENGNPLFKWKDPSK